MGRHDLSFANFVLRFGVDEVMLDFAEEIVVPAFTRPSHVRKYGETTYQFYNVVLSQVGREEDGTPLAGLSGHFVKDTVLRRHQIFNPRRGLVEDEFSIESAPSAFFILILNNHRLLYFAETVDAPTLDTFRTTAEYFLRIEWQAYIRQRLDRENITRRGTERLTVRQMQRKIPPPVLSVVPVAGQDEITEIIQRFGKIRQVLFRIIRPNDELDASETVAAIEKTFRPMGPRRLDVIASEPKGLDKQEAAKTIGEAAEGHNTEIIVDGEDKGGLKMKADNDTFAITAPIADPPEHDDALRERLMKEYEALAKAGKVRKPKTPSHLGEKIRRLLGQI